MVVPGKNVVAVHLLSLYLFLLQLFIPIPYLSYETPSSLHLITSLFKMKSYGTTLGLFCRLLVCDWLQ